MIIFHLCCNIKRNNLSFIPCLVIVLIGLVLVFMLFYSLLTAGK